MDNGGPGGGTKSASDNYPLVTWGGGEDLSRRVRWQQCLPMLSQSRSRNCCSLSAFTPRPLFRGIYLISSCAYTLAHCSRCSTLSLSYYKLMVYYIFANALSPKVNCQ